MVLSQELRSAPSPAPGLEKNITASVQDLFAELTPGAAQLKIERVPGHPEWPNPYFEVRPANPKAASIRGAIIESDLDLTIGQRASREFIGFARGGTILQGHGPKEEFRSIWQAVISGDFEERLYYRGGKISAAKAILRVANAEVIFAYAGVLSTLMAKKETVRYEAY
jgi:hypothetical protein